MRYLVGRYHEIALKGRNQWRFVEQLKRNLRGIFGDYRLGQMRSMGPRLLVTLPEDLDDATAIERARLVFGLQNFSLSEQVAPDMTEIRRRAVEAARKQSGQSFRVRARRADKSFALNSMEIDREVGAEVQGALGLKVDLEDPDFTIAIEVLPHAVYLSAGKITGAGGLPVGIAGRGMAMLSGGIDSPVAAYRMMRRGLHVDFVHFHSYPLVSAASREKAADLAAHLVRYQGSATVAFVPFAEIQRQIVASAPRPLRVVLYRRFMMRIASALAVRSGAQVLVTGESLGQVASQTLDNMTVIERAASLPLMRPLVGMDKNEIVDQARQLGTFETSILPDQDCCSLFVPKHPETHARLEPVEEAESIFDIEQMVNDATSRTETSRLTFPELRGGASRSLPAASSES